MGSDLLAVLDQLAEILDRLSLRYVVGGSLASGAWGEPRSSHDADLLIELPRERVQDLHAALERTFYADESEMLAAVSEKRAFNVIHLGLYHKVDLFVAGAGALDVAQFEGAVARNLGDGSNRTYPVTSAEVIVLRKLVGESSDRQWRDVQAVLRTQGRRLDLDRMNPLARSEGLSNLLQRAIDEAWGSGSS